MESFLSAEKQAQTLDEIKTAVQDKPKPVTEMKVEVGNFPEPVKSMQVEIVNKPNEAALAFFSMLKGDKPTEEELVSLIKPLIPAPIPGKDSKEPGPPGKNYVLTNKDKKDIASKIEVPVVEKVIERTEVIKEQPIITQEIKEVAVTDAGEVIIKKINETPTDKDEYLIDVSHVKGFKKLIEKAGKGKEGSFSASIGPIVQDEGVSLPQQIYLNFVGSGVSVTNDDTNHRTVVTISGGAASNESNGELLTPVGDTLSFTFANAPTGISVVWRGESGQIQVPSSYSVVGSTLTFSTAQTDGDGNAFSIYANSKY